MSESGPSPEDQEATPLTEETPTEASPASDETPAEAVSAAEGVPPEAIAGPEAMPADGAAAAEVSAAAFAPAASSRGRRRALSWAAAVAVVVVIVLLTTTLIVSHQAPSHSTSKGPVPLSVYGLVVRLCCSPGFQSTVQPAATQVTANNFALNAVNGTLRWKYPTPNGTGTGQVVANGVVYAGSDNGDVYALDAGTGKLLWSTTLLTFSQVQQVADGVVYGWSTNDLSGDQPDGKYEVYALDAKTGKQLWQYDADSVALIGEGVVYVVTYSGSSVSDVVGVVHALDASTGMERWHFQAPGMLDVQMVNNGQLYVLGTQYTRESNSPVSDSAIHTTLYTMDASSGAQRWSYPKNPSDSMMLLGVNAGVVDLLTQPGSITLSGALPSDSLAGLDAADGSVRWKVEIPPLQSTSGGTVTVGYGVGGPAGGLVSDGVVYIASVNDPPSAYNASTGALLWSDPQFNSDEQFPFLTLDMVANGVLYMERSSLSGNQGLYALNASTGKVLWQVLGKPLSVSAVVNGVVYASTDDSDQTLLGAPPASDNGIFALDATTGAVRWSYNLGQGLPSIAVQ